MHGMGKERRSANSERGMTAAGRRRRDLVVGLVLALVVVALAAVALADSAVEPNRTYEATVAQDAPGALFRFDDDAGATALDDAAGSADASAHDVTASAPGPFAGSHAAQFDGAGVVTLTTDPLGDAHAFTAEAWVQRARSGSGDDEVAFAIGTAGTHLSLTPAAAGDGHPLRFSLTAPAGDAHVDGPALEPGTWHHVVVVQDAKTLRLYVDGAEAGKADAVPVTPADVASANAQARLGAPIDGATGAALHGALSGVAFYNHALSAERVKAHYDAAEFPVVAGAPSAAGTPTDGETLTANPGTWSGRPPIAFTYQWHRCDADGANCADVDGATAATFRLSTTDVGHTLAVAVTATNDSGARTEISAATARVAPLPPASTTAPAISGRTRDRETLHADHGAWDGTTPLSYTYQWQRCTAAGAGCADVDGATDAAYALDGRDAGTTLRVVVTAINDGGHASAISDATGVVAAIAPQASRAPRIDGDARSGQALRIDKGEWSGTTPLSYTYQWRACDATGADCADLAGVTGTSYTPGAAAVGHTLRVAVTAVNAAGQDVATSAATALVHAVAKTALAPSPGFTPLRAPAATQSLVGASCSVTWVGGGGNNAWSTAANWSTSAVPTATDTVCAGTDATIDVQSSDAVAGQLIDDGVLHINGGTLTLSNTGAASTIAQLVMDGGALDGAATVHVTATMSWTGGTLQGAGETVLDAGATATASTCTQYWCGLRDDARTLRNQGTFTLTSGTISLVNGAMLRNEATLAVGHDQNGWSSIYGDGATALVNSGTTQAWGSGSTLSVPIANSGTVVAPSGTELTLSGGTTSTPTAGTWSGTGSGILHFQSNTYDLSGATLSGSVAIDGGTVEVTGAVTQSGPLALSGGTIRGTGTFDVHGDVLWTGGSLEGTGSTVIHDDGTLRASTCTQYWCSLRDDTRTLENHGTLTISDGSVSMYGTSVLRNEGTLAIGDDDGSYTSIDNSSGNARLVNTGALRTRGAGSAYENLPLDNQGSVTAAVGTKLYVQGGAPSGVAQTGTWATSGSGELHFNTNSYKMGDGTSVAGNVFFDGATIEAAGALAQSGNLQLAGGTLTGAGTLDINGDAAWTNTNLTGTGRTIVHTGATLQASTCTGGGCGLRDDTRALENHGTLDLSNGTMTLYNGAVLTNAGTLTIGDNDNYTGLYTDGNGGGVVNTGTYRTQGNNTIYQGAPLRNSGTLTAGVGTKLWVQGGSYGAAAETGTFVTNGSGELHFNYGNYALHDASVDGNVFFDGATIEATGTIDQTGDLQLAGGTLTGAGTLDINGDAVWTNTTLAGTGRTVVHTGSTLQGSTCTGGGCGLRDDTRELDVLGELKLTDGTITMYNGALLRNSGTLTVGDDDNYTGLYSDGNGGGLINTGTLRTHGNNTIYESLPIRNTGTVTAATGTKMWVQNGSYGSDPQLGSWGTTGSGELHFNYGSIRFGDATVDGNVFFDGATIETVGTLTETGSLQLQSGTVTGAGTLDIHGTPVWTGTTLAGTGTTIVRTGSVLQASVCTGGGCGLRDDTRLLDIRGELRVTDGTITMYNGAVLLNNGTLTIGDDDNYTGLYTDGNGSSLVNNGALRTRGNAQTYESLPIANAGSVTAVAGTQLNMQSGGTSGYVQTGSWATEGSGEVHFNSNTYALGTGTTLDGNVWIDGATMQTVGSVYQSGILTFSGGVITGAGTLDLYGDTEWTNGGQFLGSGRTVVHTGHRLHGATCTQYWCGLRYDTRSLDVHGELALTDGIISMYNGATINNDGLFTIGDDDGLYTSVDNSDGGGAKIVNTGTLRTRGNATTYMSVPLENRGLVDVIGGTVLQMQGGTPGGDFGLGGNVFGALGGTSDGTWTAETSGTLKFTSGTYLLASGATMHGAIRFEGGTVVAPDLTGVDATVDVAGGTLAISDSTATGVVDRLTLNWGTIAGPGDLHVVSNLTWIAGRMQGPGRTTLDAGGEGLLQGGSNTLALDARILTNAGHMVFTNGSFEGDNNGLLQNLGTFDANADETSGYGGFYNGYGNGGILYNRGLFQKVAGTGTTQVGWALNNAGTIVARTGKFNFTGPVTQVEPGATEQRGPGNPAAPNVQRSCAGDPVDCATGNQFEVQADVSVPGRGLGLALVRTYNSQAAAEASATVGTFGYGWTASYSDHLNIDANSGQASVAQADGSSTPFVITPGGQFQAPAWIQATLVHQGDGTYKYTLPSGAMMTFDADGHLTAQADRAGHATTVSRDSNGRIDHVTDATGRTLSYNYNANGTVASVTGPAGKTVNYTYSGGELTAVGMAGVSGHQHEFDYDGSHQLTSLTDANGHTTTTGYDAQHRVITQTDAAGRTRTWSYGDSTTTITNPGGDVTREVFSHGEPTEITRAYGTAKATTQTISYDSKFRPVTSTDGAGRSTTYGYDSAGNRTSVTDAEEHTTTLTYDDQHDVLTMSSPMGRTTTYTYNSSGNPTSRTIGTEDDALTTTYGYDGNQQLTSVTDPLSHTWTYGYDAHGNRSTQTSPTGAVTTWVYDDNSLLTSETSPRGKVTSITRDAFGRPTVVHDPLGKDATTGYDAVGNIIDTTDATGVHAHVTYDAVDEPTHVITGTSADLRTTYDDNGLIHTKTDANDHTTTYTRDVLGRIVETTDPLGRSATAQYDGGGRLTSTTDAANRTTTYDYDDAGNVLGIAHVGASSNDVTYAYNADAQRTSMTDATGQTTWHYDVHGRLDSVEDGHGDEVGYAYDTAGRETEITYPNGHTVARGYDADGHLSSITDWLGNTTTLGHDADSRLTTTTFPTSTGDVDTSTYDDAGGLRAIGMTQGVTTLASLQYGRDDAGRASGITRTGLPGGDPSYAYDNAGRLTSVNTSAYAYDGAGQPTALGATTGLAYDDAGQLTHATIGGATVNYTFNSVGERTATGGATYGYNRSGALTSAPTSTGGHVTYTYDGEGQRVTRTAGATTSRLTWDQNAAVSLLLVADGINYIYDDAGRALEQIDASGDVLYYHHDGLGSTRMLTDATGAKVATFTYDATGNRTGSTGSVSTPLGYTGAYTDPDTGLVHLQARDYDPVTAQFLTRDPIEGVTNEPYAYAGGDPLDFTDPTGLLFGIPGTPSLGDIGMGISNAAAATLDGFTDGLSTQIAGSLAGFDAECADFGGGSGVFKAIGFAASFADGSGEARLGAKLGIKALASDAEHGLIGAGPGTESAWRTLNRVDEKSSPLPFTKGGGKFKNTGKDGATILPRSDAEGNAITYKKWDQHSNNGAKRGDERVVTGSDGSAYETRDHYMTYVKLR